MAEARRTRKRLDQQPSDEQLQKWLGARVKAVRVAAKLNQDNFAHRTGLQRSYVGLVENGKRDLRLSTLHRIASTFGLQVHELLDPDFVLDPARIRQQGQE